MNRFAGAFLAACLVVPALASAAEYEIDPAHSHVGFAVKHLVVSTVRGDFAKLKGTVTYDAKKPEATKLEAVIEVDSLDTREAKRDGHLKSAEFFDAQQFPVITFVSKKTEMAGKGMLKIAGDLTLHGVTKPVTLLVTGPSQEVKNPMGKMVVGATATATLHRKDFGMTWNKAMDTGGMVVGDEVTVTIDAELMKKEGLKEASVK